MPFNQRARSGKRHKALVLAATICWPMAVTGQQPGSPPSPPIVPPAPPAAAPAASVPPFFSGTLFANYQYRGDAGPAKGSNKFDVERVHLTFRMPAGDRVNVRVTADVFQQTTAGNDAYYRGWVVRAKFAYLQYEYLRRAKWNAVARAGLIQTVFIDHEENFWPRWIATTPVEKAGYFLPGDGGVGTLVTLPNKLGEVYATITNGPGFVSRETDRFKDYSVRLSLTPLSSSTQSYARTLALTGWVYRGAVASKFVSGGLGQIGSVAAGLPRNRWGAHAAIRDPRLTAGVEYASRKDGGELGSNTIASPRTESDSTGRLYSMYTVVRPLQILNAASTSPLGLVARWDQVTPNDGTRPHYYVAIAGVTWGLSKSASVSVDYQEQTPSHGISVPASKTYFAHLVANF